VARADDNYQFPPLSLCASPSPSMRVRVRRSIARTPRTCCGSWVNSTSSNAGGNPRRAGHHALRGRSRCRRPRGKDLGPRQEYRPRHARPVGPHHGADSGKAAVGVEVPNLKATPVGLREILESEDWAGAKADLPIALGKDVSGKPLVSDLAKMPHLLIAGATGSGKSVCINAIISSILYHASPRDVRLLMVDPKIVELKMFNVLPHMLIPVVTEAKKVARRAQVAAEGNGKAVPDFRPGRGAQHQQFQQPKEIPEIRNPRRQRKPRPRSTSSTARNSKSPTTCITSWPSSTNSRT